MDSKDRELVLLRVVYENARNLLLCLGAGKNLALLAASIEVMETFDKEEHNNEQD